MKILYERVKRFLSVFARSVLDVTLPRHVKRMFFIVTVYLNLSNIHEFRRDTFSKLNELLSLADDINALRLPALFYRTLWQPADLSSYVNTLHSSSVEEEQIKAICRSVIRITPKWMKYGRTDDMLNDLRGVFQLLPQEQPVSV